LNRNSIESLEEIKGVLERESIVIRDLQFMIDSDGRFFISDPLGIDKINGAKKIAINNEEMIDQLIDASWQNIREQGGM